MTRSTRLILLVSLCVVAVSCSATQRERTIMATLATVNEARDAFVVLDRNAQATIITVAPTYERGLAALLVYRKRREFVVEAFAAAYRAIAIAATVDDYTTIPFMLDAGRHAIGALNALQEAQETP